MKQIDASVILAFVLREGGSIGIPELKKIQECLWGLCPDCYVDISEDALDTAVETRWHLFKWKGRSIASRTGLSDKYLLDHYEGRLPDKMMTFLLKLERNIAMCYQSVKL